jgi:dTDP-4-dehydrorhamnose reductase
MKTLILGGGGMLGHKLVQCWRERFDVWSTVRADQKKYHRYEFFDRERIIEGVEVENLQTVEKVIEETRPDVIVNAIGIIKQLPSAKNVIKTLQINSIFPHQLAELGEKYRARLITISTDCVFSGLKGHYTENDLSDAQDLYGKSKNLGEVTGEHCLTLRTSIIGRELDGAHSLVEWFLSNQGETVKGYTNAIYTGFPTLVLADIIADLIENHPNLNGLFQVSSDPINKYELLKLIRDAYRADIRIEPFEEFKIDRSLDSTKFRNAVGFKPLQWHRMVEMMAADNEIYKKY